MDPEENTSKWMIRDYLSHPRGPDLLPHLNRLYHIGQCDLNDRWGFVQETSVPKKGARVWIDLLKNPLLLETLEEMIEAEEEALVVTQGSLDRITSENKWEIGVADNHLRTLTRRNLESGVGTTLKRKKMSAVRSLIEVFHENKSLKCTNKGLSLAFILLKIFKE